MKPTFPFRIYSTYFLNLLILAVTLSTFSLVASARSESKTTKPINSYIHESWDTLTRSINHCDSYHDTKVAKSAFLYLPYNYPLPAEIKKLTETCNITISFLPRKITNIGDVKTNEVYPAGLLYLPYPYVVPGGRFNEMYGWDSYFIMLGLLHDDKIELANNILENYFFEIEHYGTILNANRTYHLSRSQPPFLTSAILAIYKSSPHSHAWLKRAYNYAKRDYTQWTSIPFLAGDTLLSRYYDVESIPLIEEKIFPRYYETVTAIIRKQPELISSYMDPKNELSSDYYQGERSLRASGFDITQRFGPFGGKTHHYAPVCLNSLLYKTAKDLALMAKILHKTDDYKHWLRQALQRKIAIQKYLWDPEAGIYVDYDFITRQKSTYHYATTFYPLWAGIATPEQAQSIVDNLGYFEQAGGLAMSDVKTGVQWDKPYGWAPIQLLSVMGLAEYGYKADARRIANKFNRTVLASYEKNHKIYEKYDVVDSTETFNAKVGYEENVIGFGWTNASYVLLHDFINLIDHSNQIISPCYLKPEKYACIGLKRAYNFL